MKGLRLTAVYNVYAAPLFDSLPYRRQCAGGIFYSAAEFKKYVDSIMGMHYNYGVIDYAVIEKEGAYGAQRSFA